MIEISQSIIVERYRQLVKAMDNLASITDPELLLASVANTAVMLGEAELAWLLFPDQANHRLIPKVSCPDDDQATPSILANLDDSLEGWVYQHQQMMVINDPAKYGGEHGTLLSLPNRKIRSILAIPVSSNGKRHFVLEVANKMKGEFTPTDQDIMVSFARHAAVYIEKSRHLQQTDLVPELVHELRTPLAALNTAIHLLQRPDLPDEKRDQISEIIQMEFNRLTDLTTAFLDYSRLESGKEKFKRTRFDLNELIQDCIKVVQMQFYGRDLLFSFDLKAEPLNVTADRDKIKQVVLNLLNNAIKYSPPGGVITISVGISSSNVRFSIQDHGPGIPPEFLPRLFERFYRVPKTALQIKGTGLGLTICKQIVETHDGRIEVASTVGEGSTFTVYLPAENSQ